VRAFGLLDDAPGAHQPWRQPWRASVLGVLDSQLARRLGASGRSCCRAPTWVGLRELALLGATLAGRNLDDRRALAFAAGDELHLCAVQVRREVNPRSRRLWFQAPGKAALEVTGDEGRA